MTFQNPSSAVIQTLLRTARTIAIIGLSDDPRRPSCEVGCSLLDFGYRIIPVNPALSSWKGRRAVPSLDHLGEVLDPDESVDIVDVFRRSEHVAGIVEDCIRLKLPALWLQLGVVDPIAANRAVVAGITVVMDRCIKVDRMLMG